jgi:hypothetical protein
VVKGAGATGETEQSRSLVSYPMSGPASHQQAVGGHGNTCRRNTVRSTFWRDVLGCKQNERNSGDNSLVCPV